MTFLLLTKSQNQVRYDQGRPSQTDASHCQTCNLG
ncbi:hypothetical protein D039_2263A, partial [Vibrio parahaemolyticus EKP-028]